MLNIGRLRILKEVAHQGSFSAAADALSYTQSAISQQIATLETETGLTLLERHPRGVSLTAAGQTLVGHAEGILARLEAAQAALSAIAGLRGGRLRMASFPTAGATLMPLAIATFRNSYPQVDLTLAEGEPEEILPRLRAGELDLALLFEFAGEASLAEEMVRVELLEDPMYLALPFESDDYQTVQGLVAAGVGVALIPELALSVVRGDIVIRALSPRPPARRVVAAAPAGARLVPAAPAMLEILAQAATRYQALDEERLSRDTAPSVSPDVSPESVPS
jgi:DNA-binding transcriptional LysR family regulator